MIELIAVQTTVLSVSVLPISVGQVGSELPDVPAVVHSKTRPLFCDDVARRTSPTENAVLAAQAV